MKSNAIPPLDSTALKMKVGIATIALASQWWEAD